MRRRWYAAVGAVAVLGVIVTSTVVKQGDVQAQEREYDATTAWGEPDLQGIWTVETNEPLQRPARYKDREFLSDEERAELDKRIADIVSRESDESRRSRGTEQDVAGAYSTAIFMSHLPVGRRTSMIIDPPDGRMPPLTEQERRKRAAMMDYARALLQATDACRDKPASCPGVTPGPPSPRRLEPPPFYLTDGFTGVSGGGAINRSDGPEDRNVSERCLPSGLPSFGGYRRIVQSKGQIAVLYDVGQGQAWQRVIPVTAAAHLPASVSQWWGDSRARWDGNTLVVDVTNFSPKSNYLGAGANLHLVEKWTRTGPDTLQYTVTIDDPTVWTRPWTATREFKRQDERANRIYPEPRCHEGNYGMVAMLAGARADELAFKQGKGPDPATKCLSTCGGFGGGFAEEGDDVNPLQ